MNQVTQHAHTRMQQRGIKQDTLEFLFEYGAEYYGGNNMRVLYFNKESRAKLLSNLSKSQKSKIDSQLNAYAIITDEGQIITVGHRTKKITRH
jgi:hypothetical protein